MRAQFAEVEQPQQMRAFVSKARESQNFALNFVEVGVLEHLDHHFPLARVVEALEDVGVLSGAQFLERRVAIAEAAALAQKTESLLETQIGAFVVPNVFVCRAPKLF